jgi:hypothetical protein
MQYIYLQSKSQGDYNQNHWITIGSYDAIGRPYVVRPGDDGPLRACTTIV